MTDFATVTELEEFMGLPLGGLGARGTSFLGYASAEIRLAAQQDIDAVAGRQEEHAGMPTLYIDVTETPLTNVSAIAVDGIAFTEFVWNRWGSIRHTDYTTWGTDWLDPVAVLVTYDSGYAAASDEMQAVKLLCLEVASRAIGGREQDTYGLETPELRGAAPAVFLTQTETQQIIDMFRPLTVA